MALHESASYFPAVPARQEHQDRPCRFDYVRRDPNSAGTVIAILKAGVAPTPAHLGFRRRDATVSSRTTGVDDDVYELSPTELGDAMEWRSAATYTLDVPVRCPYCDERIQALRIIGLTRSQVAFTSTLPRKGRVATCPECDRILPAELAGLM
jgi:hypothetical protein